MRIRYDLHLHSCLSPCGDDEMTPANLVNMAALLELDVIALTDHNTAGNCRSAVRAGQRAGLLVLPGMELCTSEEVHVVCVFAELDAAEAFGTRIHDTLPPVRNRPAVFGNQRLVDDQDHITGEEDLLLVTASAVSIEEVTALVEGYGGVCFPAHIDRSSFSALSALGLIAERWGFRCAELSRRGNEALHKKNHPILEQMRILRNSDSHNLEDFACYEPQTLELPASAELGAQAVLDLLARPSHH